MKYLPLLAFALSLPLRLAFSDSPKDKGNRNQISIIRDVRQLNINNIDLPIQNNGSTGEDGQGYYPSGQTFLSFLFHGGFATTGYINGELRASWMAPSGIIEEWQAGTWAMDPTDPLAKFYEVSIKDGTGSQAYIDWTDAVSLGADFIDEDGNGQYDPYIDRPGLLGDKTYWTVFNDGTPMSQRIPRLGTLPLGQEIRQTAWAYDSRGYLDDIIFFRFQLTNADTSDIDDLIFSVWEDPDIGDFTDDLIGCDTLLDVGYCYNSGNDLNYGSNPPAFGVKLLQGFVVDSPGDTALVFRGAAAGIDTILNKRNLPWTSFMHYISSDPVLGSPQNAQTARYYQLGGLDANGNPLIPTQWGSGATPTTNPLYVFSGDPITGTGWLDVRPSDKYFLINNGPLQLPSGGTQDIIFAFVVARGNSALNSIELLRERAAFLNSFFPLGRLLEIDSNDSLISVDSTFTFRPALYTLAYPDTIQSVLWQLNDQPSGSVAQIVTGPGLQASLKPDSAGAYTIYLEATTGRGDLLTKTLTVEAVNSRPPVAALNITPPYIIFGQSALADAGSSSDPDGDTLHFSWEFPLWITVPTSDTSAIDFIPPHIGAGEVKVTVNDFYFSSISSDSFFVTPLANGLSNTSDNKQLNSVNDLKFLDGKIYALEDDRFYVLDPNLHQPPLGISLFGGIKFETNGSLVAIINSSRQIDLYEIDPSYQLELRSNMNETVLPYENKLLDIHLNFPYLYVPATTNSLLVFDISNPFNPSQVFSYSLPSLLTDFSFQEGAFATFYSRFPHIGLVALDISNPPQISPLDTMNLPSMARMIAAGGDRIYVTNGLPLSNQVQIIEASQPDNLQLAGTLSATSIIGSQPSITELEIGDDFLLLGTSDGAKIFDCIDPDLPFERVNYHTGLEVASLSWNKPFVYAGFQGDSAFGGGLSALEYDSTFVSLKGEKKNSRVPENFKLFQNYPNPFNPATTIEFDLPKNSLVSLQVFNILGEKVASLVSDKLSAGSYSYKWKPSNLASGVYLYRLQTGDYVLTKKMVLMR